MRNNQGAFTARIASEQLHDEWDGVVAEGDPDGMVVDGDGEIGDGDGDVALAPPTCGHSRATCMVQRARSGVRPGLCGTAAWRTELVFDVAD